MSGHLAGELAGELVMCPSEVCMDGGSCCLLQDHVGQVRRVVQVVRGMQQPLLIFCMCMFKKSAQAGQMVTGQVVTGQVGDGAGGTDMGTCGV
jgi:hypothetical protein